MVSDNVVFYFYAPAEGNLSGRYRIRIITKMQFANAARKYLA
jgi:hypothetical protein